MVLEVVGLEAVLKVEKTQNEILEPFVGFGVFAELTQGNQVEDLREENSRNIGILLEEVQIGVF